MHYPWLRAIALSHKALLGLHAQAMAAGNAADTQVHGPAVSRTHVGQILGYWSPGFVIIMIDFELLLVLCDACVFLRAWVSCSAQPVVATNGQMCPSAGHG